jgi:serine/threonine-protein kinase
MSSHDDETQRSAGPPRSSPPAPDDDTGRIVAGKYRITRQLGRGGMGAVYEAQHLTLGIGVAVKVMHPHVAADPETSRRFAREARAVSMLAHPNVVRIMDFGVDGSAPYMVMELLRGESCGDWLDHLTAPPPLADVHAVLAPVLEALEAAHRLGIVHRDLKPDNVFLARDDADRLVVKVVDFGLAHVNDPVDGGPTLTKTDMVAGTPDYMSPEQCRSLVVGPESDLYAFGCILTTMLQLAPPFDGRSTADLMSQHLFVPPKPLRRPDGAEPIPPELERLRLDLLAKNPDRRPSPARVVLERLHEALDPRSVRSSLATRKGEEPSGDRASRAGTWSTAAPASTSAPATASADRAARIVRLAGASGLGGQHETSLAMQSISLAVHRSPDVPAALDEPLVVLDAGNDFDGAVAFLSRLAATHPRARAIVCLADLSTAHLASLIAAGAADAVGYPIAPDVLARKVDRVLRRRR